MHTLPENLSYDEFLAYLLTWAACCDNELNEEEKELIVRKVGDAGFVEIKAAFDHHKDYQRLALIESYREKYYATAGEVEKLLADLKEIFLADEEYNSVEQSYFIMIRHLLTNR